MSDTKLLEVYNKVYSSAFIRFLNENCGLKLSEMYGTSYTKGYIEGFCESYYKGRPEEMKRALSVLVEYDYFSEEEAAELAKLV